MNQKHPTQNDPADLRTYFTDAEPLGPDYLEARTPLVAPLVYQDNLPYRRLVSNPSMVIGRKGSGKSSILRSVEFDRKYTPELIIELPPDDTFAVIVELLNNNVKDTLFVEQIATVWEFLLWNVVIAKSMLTFRSDENELVSALSKYCLDLQLPLTSPPYLIMRAALNVIINRRPTENLVDFVRYSTHGGLSFPSALSATQQLLHINGKRGILLLDSMEQFRLDVEKMYPALSGFLKSLASFRIPGSVVDIRCCIPSELYFSLIEISTNPNKDFSNSQMLHWSSMELLELAAVRYATFISIKDPALHDKLVDHMNFHDRKIIRKFWFQFFPETTVNQLGFEEDTLAYILRHTQLLPRHIIRYANEILRGKLQTFLEGQKLNSADVVEAISRIEGSICDDIIAGFAEKYPIGDPRIGVASARELCEKILRHMPMQFEFEEFRTAYRRHVANSIKYIPGPEEAMRVLVEIGSVGRLVRITGRYYVSMFEYTVPHKLVTSKDTVFCVHPVFIERFGARRIADGKTVLPFGTDPFEEDYREWGRE